jgi:hypothetical protein|tara:strand:+ start:545 stop:973 length:429 start_codon:yes stop_codon:yes gene_type:complete
MARKLVSEVLAEAGKIVIREERIKFLRLNKSPGLTDILRIQYDDSIVSVLPLGAPSYKQDDAPKGYEYTILNKAYTQFKYFFKGPVSSGMKPLKREGLFLNLLESLNPEEAELLIAAKDKKMKSKGITKRLVNDTFPGLLVK